MPSLSKKALDLKLWQLATAEASAMFPKNWLQNPRVSPETFAQVVLFHYRRRMASSQESEEKA